LERLARRVIMTANEVMHSNPYVGPRPFADNDQERRLFFGRERESADLLSLVMAERIVLFYAPSGAGKSSLINARLLPALRDEGFTILGKARVGGQLPSDAQVNQIDNVYMFNLLRDLDQDRTDHSALAQQRLSDYLAANPANPDRPDRVLIIDQFEELFTTYADQWPKREEFFRQLNQALSDDPHLWMILTMREDYIAEVDPYARLLPNRIRVRYRMQYMGQAAALDAVQQPATLGGRPFEPNVAENLVNNLRQMSDGEADAPNLGEHVEPVQLQVVCMQLWENLRTRPGDTITAADLESLSRGAGLSEFVNHALAMFYEQTLQAVLTTNDALVSEREVRDWFSHTLITRDGTRNLLYQSEGETGGMPNTVVLELERRFLLRGETRGGGRWVELVHDRLVEPIREANEAWRRTYPLVVASELWNVNRSPAQLLTGDGLVEAQRELAAFATRYGPLERQFVAISAEAEATRRAAAESEEKRRKQEATRDRIITVGASVMALIMLLLLLTSLWLAQQSFSQSQQSRLAADRALAAEKRANEQAQLASQRADEANQERERAQTAQARTEQLNRQIRADQLANQAVLSMADSPQQALLLAVEAVALSQESGAQLSHTVEQSVHDILHATGGAPFSTGGGDPVALVLSPDARWFALSDAEGAISLWRTDDPAADPIELATPGGALALALAASPDGSRLAAAHEDGILRVWQVDAPALAPTEFRGEQAPLAVVAFSPDGSLLAVGDDAGALFVWNANTVDAAPLRLDGHTAGIRALTFSLDGAQLASGGDDGRVLLWPLTQGAPPIAAAIHDAGVRTISFSPDGVRLASGDNVGSVRLFTQLPDAAEGGISEQLPGHTVGVSAMDFSSNGVWLASGDVNGVMRVANLVDPAQSYVTPAYNSTLTGLAFVRSATGDRLITTGNDFAAATSVRLWDYANFGLTPATLRGHDDSIFTLATAPGVNGFLTAGYDRSLRVWPVDSPFAAPEILATGVETVDKIALAAAPARLYTIGAAAPFVQTWDARTGQAGEPLRTGREDGLTALAVTLDGGLIAAGDTGGYVHLWTDPAALPTASFPAHTGAVSALTFENTGRLLVTGGVDGAVLLLHLDDLSTLRTLVEEPAQISALAFAPTGDQIAYSDTDGGVTLQPLIDGEPADPTRLSAQESELATLAFSPDGSLLAAGGLDGVVRLWDLRRPARPPQRWNAHPNEVNTVLFGVDRDHLLTTSADYTVRLWNLADVLKTPVILRGHRASVNDVVYVEQTAYTLSTDGTIRRWLLAPGDLTGRACAVAGRNLYSDEWARYFPETPCEPTCAALPDRCGQQAP
jgi:WD40 repeat protein